MCSRSVVAIQCMPFSSRTVVQVPAELQPELSAHKSPTLHRVFPLIEKLMMHWENMAAQDKFEPIKDAIEAGLRNIVKWYWRTDETSIYFVAHGSVACSSFFAIILTEYVLISSSEPYHQGSLSSSRMGRSVRWGRYGTFPLIWPRSLCMNYYYKPSLSCL